MFVVAACSASAGSANGNQAQGKTPPPGSAIRKSTYAATTGPFKYKIVACGKLTQAERNAANTNSKYGVVIQATNVGSSVPLTPQYTVQFDRGSMVDGENYPGDESPLSKGQSQDLEADIVPSSGAGHPGDTCKITEEDVYKDGHNVGTYYP